MEITLSLLLINMKKMMYIIQNQKLFPSHNIAGTSGRDLFGELQDVYETYKNAENVYYMDKTRYSAFAGTDLEMKLRKEVKRFIL